MWLDNSEWKYPTFALSLHSSKYLFQKIYFQYFFLRNFSHDMEQDTGIEQWIIIPYNTEHQLDPFKSISIVLVDLNKFPSIFQKEQHSHSRHQKTTSNLLNSQFKRQIKVQQNMATRGSCVHKVKPMLNILWGHPQNFSFMQFSQNMDGFRQNNSQGF